MIFCGDVVDVVGVVDVVVLVVDCSNMERGGKVCFSLLDGDQGTHAHLSPVPSPSANATKRFEDITKFERRSISSLEFEASPNEGTLDGILCRSIKHLGPDGGLRGRPQDRDELVPALAL